MICRPRFLFFASLALSLLGAVACGKDSPTQPAVQTPARITLTVGEATLTSIGQTLQIAATVLDQSGKAIPGIAVRWMSSNSRVARVGANGMVTAVENGSTMVTATAGSVSASANVTVAQTVNRITVAPGSSTLTAIGETLQLSATVYDRGNQPISGAEVNWTTSNASVSTIGDNGLVTAVANGAAQVTATSGSASATITITVAQNAGSISITPKQTNLTGIGQTQQLSATVTDANGVVITNANPVWTSDNPDVATVTSDGLVTAVANGNAQVTATVGPVSAAAAVTVVQVAGSITITQREATLTSIGETLQLTAVVVDVNGVEIVEADVTWSSDDPDAVSVSDDGLATAVSDGNAQITARYGEATASISVRVSLTAHRISVSPAHTTLTAVGHTVQLHARVLDAGGTEITEADPVWESSDLNVASVNEHGLVTAVANGTARITATLDGASDYTVVTMKQRPDHIAISPSDTTLTALGKTVQLVATVYDPNRMEVLGVQVVWESSDANAASVNESGLVTAVANGSARITAILDGASAYTTISVMQRPDRITIAPSDTTLTALGHTLQLHAKVLDAGGTEITEAEPDWESSDVNVASVSERTRNRGGQRLHADHGEPGRGLGLRDGHRDADSGPHCDLAIGHDASCAWTNGTTRRDRARPEPHGDSRSAGSLGKQ